MHNRDQVIRFATACAQAHGYEVRQALAAFISDPTGNNLATLRITLVAQASGFEATCHDGSTADARKEYAQLALDAWDGTGELPEGWAEYDFAGATVRAPTQLWSLAGFRLQRHAVNGPVSVSGPSSFAGYADNRLAAALAEGLQHEHAVRRVIQMAEERSAQATAVKVSELELAAAKENEKAAGMQLAAQREISKRGER